MHTLPYTGYLDVESIKEICHPLAVAVFDKRNDPIPNFDTVHVNLSLLKSALANPSQTFGGKELYPTLEEKATILLYTLIRNHAFLMVIKELQQHPYWSFSISMIFGFMLVMTI